MHINLRYSVKATKKPPSLLRNFKQGVIFFKFCALLRISELYRKDVSTWENIRKSRKSRKINSFSCQWFSLPALHSMPHSTRNIKTEHEWMHFASRLAVASAQHSIGRTFYGGRVQNKTAFLGRSYFCWFKGVTVRSSNILISF